MNDQTNIDKASVGRRFEKRLTAVAGVWEIFVGLITIFFYAPYYRREGLDLIEDGIPLVEAGAINSIFSSLYMFIVILGVFFILLGLINLFFAKKIRHDQAEKKIPIFWMLAGVLFYFMMDFISAILLLTAGVLAFAKNKSIVKNKIEGCD